MIDAFKTDKGVARENNEDYITYSSNSKGDKIYILCDGMGGYKGGEIASRDCGEFIKKEFIKSEFNDIDEAKKWIYNLVMKANKMIRKKSKENIELTQMGTTLLCLIIASDFKLYVSVGDSRIYTYNNKELIQLSEDQTFANALLKAGYINQKEAKIHPKKNLLLCAMGSSDEDLDVQIEKIEGKNNYLLCSDGLYNMITDREILKILNKYNSIEDKVKALIDIANHNGGKDNISVILVEECL